MHKHAPVLSVSPSASDHQALAKIMRTYGLIFMRASSLCGAKLRLQDHEFSLVICEHDLRPDSWKDLLVLVSAMAKPPLFIVTSQVADDHLWAEVLNWGVYDVLAKPFRNAEVIRTLSVAALHWEFRYNYPKPSRVKAAGA